MEYAEEPTPNLDKDKDLRGKWLDRIKLAGKWQKDWEERAGKVIDRYRDQRKSHMLEYHPKRFNILWSNIETLKPALYSNTPKPLATRRYKDNDPVGREAAEILERSIEYVIDNQDFDDVVRDCLEDYLLPGRAVGKIIYKPTFGKELEKGLKELVFEETYIKYYGWKDFRHSKARKWDEVTWVAFRNYLTKEEVNARFGKGKAAISYSGEGDKDKEQPDRTVPVWEIWDKTSRKVIWVSEECSVFEAGKPPLRLQKFFPCPKPLYAITTNNTLEPIPEYTLYQDQAEEIDVLTTRINLLVTALRVAGVYDASFPGLEKLVTDGDENLLIPVDSWAALAEKGGLKGVVDWMPVDQIATVVISLYEAREKTKQELYEITGLADIIRGASQAVETATAQRIKGQFASLRLRDRQKQIGTFTRDLIRLLAEVIAEHFQPETLHLMTNREITPPVMELIRNQHHRDFRIDIETDSTLEADEQADKESRIEFMSAASEFLQGTLPIAQEAPELAPFLGEMLMFGVRGFRAGRELEEKLEQALQQLASRPQQEPQTDPKAAAEAKKIEQDAQIDQAEFQRDTQKMVANEQRDQESHELDMAKKELELVGS